MPRDQTGSASQDRIEIAVGVTMRLMPDVDLPDLAPLCHLHGCLSPVSAHLRRPGADRHGNAMNGANDAHHQADPADTALDGSGDTQVRPFRRHRRGWRHHRGRRPAGRHLPCPPGSADSSSMTWAWPPAAAHRSSSMAASGISSSSGSGWSARRLPNARDAAPHRRPSGASRDVRRAALWIAPRVPYMGAGLTLDGMLGAGSTCN